MWNCVEDRVGNDKYGGRVIRRIIFDDIYADRIAVLSQNPISRAAYPHLKSGDKVVFYDNCEIKEGSFLLSSEQKSTYLNPKTIIGEVLSTEEEIRNFCKSHGIAKNAQSLHTLVIEAYLFLERKMSSARETHFPDNTGSRMSSPMSRKRPAPVMNEQLAQAKASRILNAMGFPNPALAVPPLSSAPNLSPIALQAQQLALQQQISSKNKEENNETQTKKAKNEAESIEPKSPENQAASENSNSMDIQANSQIENITEAEISEIEIKTEPTGGEIAVVELEENNDDNLPLDQLPGPSNTNNVFQNPSDFQLSNNQLSRNGVFPNVPVSDQNDPASQHWALMQMSGLTIQNGLQQLANTQNSRTPPRQSSKTYSTKLTDEQRIDIIKIFVLQKTSKAQLGRMYGVSDVSIHKVIKNKEKWIVRALGKLRKDDPDNEEERQLLGRLLEQAMIEQNQARLEQTKASQIQGPSNNPRLYPPISAGPSQLAIGSGPQIVPGRVASDPLDPNNQRTSLNLDMSFARSPYFDQPSGLASTGQRIVQDGLTVGELPPTMKVEVLEDN